MSLKEKINQDFIAARKAKNKVVADVLTMVRTAIRYKEIEKKKELADDEIMAVVSHEIKQRKDSMAQFSSGNRQDLVAKEKKELDILMAYLPAQLSESEITDLVSEAIKKSGASGPKDMGKVMGLLMKDLKGKADGSLVQQLVRKKLADK